MTTKLHILATCLTPELLPATLLVFRTVRTGFPTARISVWGNGLSVDAEGSVKWWCDKLDAKFIECRTSHDEWIGKVIENSFEPCWICDTDVVFFGNMENIQPEAPLCGRYEPPFVEPWTKTLRVERLHTAVMRLDAPSLRESMRDYVMRCYPKGFPFYPEIEFIKQHYVPRGACKAPFFFDTCAGLFQAIGGQRFTEEQNACFEHLHCGTYSNRIAGALPGISEVHSKVFNDPQTARGLRLEQQKFYEANVWN